MNTPNPHRIAGDGRPARWRSISASVRGASHTRSGKPNQDAVRCVRTTGGGLVAVVCDGHGGERYVRSDVGARMATEVATDVGSAVLAHLMDGHHDGATQSDVETALANSVPVLLSFWRERVAADLLQRPFDTTEVKRGVDLNERPIVAYGCTLVMGVFGPGFVGFVQIGDGDVTTVDGDTVGSPVPADNRLIANQTTSLCLPTAASDARVTAIIGDLPDLVLLSTDGYANSFSGADWRQSAGVDMLAQVDRHGLDEVERLLPGWLEDSANASGDDVTMAIIRRLSNSADDGQQVGGDLR